jgi:hypothetical protein
VVFYFKKHVAQRMTFKELADAIENQNEDEPCMLASPEK